MARPHLWDRGKERLWRQHLARWRKSGLTGRDFCAREGLSEHSFYGWKRTLRLRDQQVAATSTARRTPARPARSCPERPPDSAPPVRLVPVRLTLPDGPAPAALASPALLELVLPGGCVLRLRPGFDALALRQLLAVLAEDPAC